MAASSARVSATPAPTPEDSGSSNTRGGSVSSARVQPSRTLNSFLRVQMRSPARTQALGQGGAPRDPLVGLGGLAPEVAECLAEKLAPDHRVEDGGVVLATGRDRAAAVVDAKAVDFGGEIGLVGRRAVVARAPRVHRQA